MSSLEAVVAHRVRAIPAARVIALYRCEDWWPERTEEQVADVLRRAPAVGAWDRTAGLVGFVRSVTDGVLRAYVEDLIVLPEQRGQGIGRRLLTELRSELAPVPIVTLFSSRTQTPLYESTGYRPTRQVVLHLHRDAR